MRHGGNGGGGAGTGNIGNSNPGGTGTPSNNAATISTSAQDAQLVSITDVISEGPILGLVDGSASVFLNNDRIHEVSAVGQRVSHGPMTITLTNGSASATINNATSTTPLVANAELGAQLLIRGGTLSETSVTSSYDTRHKVSLSTSSSTFTNAMVTAVGQRGRPDGLVPGRIKPSGSSTTPDGLPIEGFIWRRVSGTEALWRSGAFGDYNDFRLDDGTYKLELDKIVTINAGGINGTAITLASAWDGTSGTYSWDKISVVNMDISEVGSRASQRVQGGTVNFRPGTLNQTPMRSGGSTAVSKGIGEQIEVGTARFLVGSGNCGLTEAQLLEVDKIRWRIVYPAGFKAISGKGNDKTTYIRYRISIAIKEEGDSDFGGFTIIRNPLTHSGNYTNSKTFESDLNLERFRPFTDFKIKIERLDTDDDPGFKSVGQTYKDWTNVTAGQLAGVTSILNEKLNHPYTAMADVSFSTKQYQGIPQRTYDLYGKMVRVPSNYVTREEATNGVASYNRNTSTGAITSNYQDWDGTFRDELVYSNNPAWIYYDILTNNRYGLGSFIKELDIDKYALYRVARYCDGLVPDGKGGLEPRFTLNTYLTKAANSYKVLKDLATNFLGLLYYLDGQLYTSLDAPAAPVYTFNKTNVMDGTFNYESSSEKTRSNQIIVNWNDPTKDYKMEPLIVEDERNIVNTGRIISETAVAFGCTSEGQATRYGKWKLWTAANQKEIASFSASLEGAFVAPGDIINIQDADRYAVRLGGRISGNLTRDLTVTSSSFTARAQISSDNAGGFTATQRSQPTFMEGKLVLPTSVTQDRVIFEYGGTTSGCWIGVRKVSNVDTLTFQAGNGAAGISASGTNGVYKEIPIADIPEFDGNSHTVSWHFHPSNGTGRLWIDGRLIIDEATTDGSAFTNSTWAGSNVGGWGQGYGGIAGNFASTQWIDTIDSNLSVYANQVPVYPTKSYIPLDSTVLLNSGSTYTLSLVYPKPAAFTREAVTIGGVSYEAGDLIHQAYVDGSLTVIDTKEKSVNARVSASSGAEPLTLDFNANLRTETKDVTSSQIGSSVTSITVTSAFTEAPTKESLWVLQETKTGLQVKGSKKEYKVLSISENSNNTYDITCIEHYDSKWTSVEEDFTTYIQGDLEPSLLSTDIVPPVENLIARSHGRDNGTSHETLLVSWDPPAAEQAYVRNSTGGRHNQTVSQDYEYLLGYIVEHNLPEYENPMRVGRDTTELLFSDLVPDDYTITVRTVNAIDNVSEATSVQATITDRFQDAIPRFPLGLPYGGTSNVAIKTINSTFGDSDYGLFELAKDVYIFSPAQTNGFGINQTSTAASTYQQDVSGIEETAAVASSESGTFIDRHYYMSLNSAVATDNLTLLKYNKTPLHHVPYWYDAGNGSNLTGLTNLTGTISVSGSTVTGSGTSFTTELAVGALLQTTSTVAAIVTSVVSDTTVYIDRILPDGSGITAQTNNHRFDFDNETIIAKVYATDNGGANKVFSIEPYMSLDANVQAQQGVTRTLYKRVANDGLAGTINTSAGTFDDPADGAATGWQLTNPGLQANFDRIYAITRIFTNDGLPPQEASWSAASIVARQQDGAAGIAAKVVSLRASKSVIEYAADGTTAASQTITLTAESKNFDDGYFRFTADDASFTTIDWVDGSTANTKTATYNIPISYNADPITFTVQVKEGSSGSEEARDVLTIPSIKPGVDAVDALTVVMTNEAHAIPRASTTATPDFTGSGNTIRVFEGTTELDHDNIGTAAGHYQVVTTGSTNCTPGSLTGEGSSVLSATFGPITAITGATALVKYTITGKRADGTSFSIIRFQSLTRTTDGAPGQPSTDEKTVIVYKKFAAGVSAPTAITFTSGNDATNQTHANPTNGLDGWTIAYPSISAEGDRVYSGQRTFTLTGSDSAWTFNGLVAEIKTGPRTATIQLHYGSVVTDGSSPTKPTVSDTHTFNFATSTFGTIKTGWQHGAPTYASGNSNAYYYSMATITESSFGGSQTITFGNSTQAIGFSGLVTFTSAGTLGVEGGTDSITPVEAADVTDHIGGINTSTIDGGKINAGSSVTVGTTGTNRAGLSGVGTAETDIRVFSGAAFADRATAPFRVTQAGEFRSSTGIIGGFTFGDDAMTTSQDTILRLGSDLGSNIDQSVTLSSRAEDDYVIYAGHAPTDDDPVTTEAPPPFGVEKNGNVTMRSYQLTDTAGAIVFDSENLLGGPVLAQIQNLVGNFTDSVTTSIHASGHIKVELGAAQNVQIGYEVPLGNPYVSDVSTSVTDVMNALPSAIKVNVEYSTDGGVSWSLFGAETFSRLSSTDPNATTSASQYLVHGDSYDARSGGTRYVAHIVSNKGAVSATGGLKGTITGSGNLAAGTYLFRIDDTSGTSGNSGIVWTVGSYTGGYTYHKYGSNSANDPAQAFAKTADRVYTVGSSSSTGGTAGAGYTINTNTSPPHVKDSTFETEYMPITGGTFTGGINWGTDTAGINYGTYGTGTEIFNVNLGSNSNGMIIGLNGNALQLQDNLNAHHSFDNNGDIRFKGDLKQLDDGDTKISFTNDKISFLAGNATMMELVEASTGYDYVRLGNTGDGNDTITFNLSAGSGVFTGNVTAYSDISLKENIEVIDNAVDKVSKLRGVTFDRIDKEAVPRQTGLIAQELEKVLPEAVETNELSGIKSVAYGNVVGLLVEAIKELKEEINELKKEKNNATTSVRK